jgi:hypothetical protein
MKLITNEQAARHLRLDDLTDSEVAADLEDKILQVSGMVLDYIEKPISPWADSNGDPLGVPFHVQAATLVWLGILWKNRDGESDETLEFGFIPKTVSYILHRTRKPAYA